VASVNPRVLWAGSVITGQAVSTGTLITLSFSMVSGVSRSPSGDAQLSVVGMSGSRITHKLITSLIIYLLIISLLIISCC